jgi:hypothetical protein
LFKFFRLYAKNQETQTCQQLGHHKTSPALA